MIGKQGPDVFSEAQAVIMKRLIVLRIIHIFPPVKKMEETAINSCLSLCSVFHTFFVPCLLCDTLKARARRSILILEILLYLKDLKTSRNSRNVSSLPWVIDPLPGYLSFPLSSVSRLLKKHKEKCHSSFSI